MNKKVMAIAMAAVMLMVAVTVGVSVQSDANGELGSQSNPREIIGSKTGGTTNYYTLYIGEPNGVSANIDFNRAAFSTNAVVTLSHDNPSGITITITPATVDAQFDGRYTVKFVGNTASQTGETITFTLIVQDYACSNSHENGTHTGNTADCVALPEQKFYYVAYIKVASDGGTFTFTENTTQITEKTVNFTQSVNITTAINGGPTGMNYKFYATGLPTGISMTVNGTLGGKLSSTTNYQDQDDQNDGMQIKSKIYAVSDYGVVKSTDFTWTIGDKPENNGSFTITINGNTISNGYVAIKETDPVSLTVGAKEGCTIKTDSLSVIGYDSNPVSMTETSEGSGTYTGSITATGGTGTYKLSITATLQGTGVVDKIVTQYVTVYVVGSIVDSDLKPTVSPRA